MTFPVQSPSYASTATNELLDLFGVCLRARHLLYMHKKETAAIPGFSDLYEEINAAVERAVGV